MRNPFQRLKKRNRLFHGAMLMGVLLMIFVLRNYFFVAFSVLQKPLVSAGTRAHPTVASFFRSCTVREKEISTCFAQRNSLAINQSELETLRRDNDILRNEIGFLKRRSLHGIPADVIQRTVSTSSPSFTLNKGKRDGIVAGSAVIVDDGVYVGKISRVEETYSVVTPSTASTSATGVSLFNQSRTIGIAKGKSGNLIEIEFVPVDEIIRVNDLVVTSGLEENIPTGLFVGMVNTVRPDPEAPFQHAIVEPPVNVNRYDHAIVLAPSL